MVVFYFYRLARRRRRGGGNSAAKCQKRDCAAALIFLLATPKRGERGGGGGGTELPCRTVLLNGRPRGKDASAISFFAALVAGGGKGRRESALRRSQGKREKKRYAVVGKEEKRGTRIPGYIRSGGRRKEQLVVWKKGRGRSTWILFQHKKKRN